MGTRNRRKSYVPVADGDTQTIQLPNGESIEVEGYRLSICRLLTIIVFSLLTLLIGLWLLSRRYFSFMRWIHSKCELAEATRVVLRASVTDRENRVTAWKPVGSNGKQRWFTWRHFRLVWCPATGRFQRVQDVFEGHLTLTQIHDLPSKLESVGHMFRKETYGHNLTSIPSLHWLGVLFKILLHPFRIFQVGCAVLWSLQNYSVYSGIFTLICTVEIAFKVVMKFKQGSQLQAASLNHKSLPRTTVTLVNPFQNERSLVFWQDVVPGNVIELSDDGSICLCDALILSGSCLVEDSGQHLEHKFQLPKSSSEVFDIVKHRNHVIMRGSTMAAANHKVTVLVLRTGWGTEHGAALSSKLMESESTTEDQSPHSINYLYAVLLLIGVAASIYTVVFRIYRQSSVDWWKTLLSSLDLLTICLPPVFPAALSLVNFIGLFRLHRRGLQFHQPFNPSVLIHRTATADSVAFFTGALMKDSESSITEASTADESALDLATATCHTLTLAEDHHSLVGSPEDIRMFPLSTWKLLATGRVRCIMDGEMYRIARLYSRTCTCTGDELMLVRADADSDHPAAVSWYFVKGSAPSVAKFIRQSSENRADLTDPHLIVYAGRPLTAAERSHPYSEAVNLDSILQPQSFRYLGTASFQLKVCQSATAAVSELRAAGLRTLLVSMGGCREAVRLARRAGIILPEEPVAAIDIPYADGRSPPSLSIVDLPDLEGEDSVPGSWSNGQVRKCPHVVLDGRALESLLDVFPEMVDRVISRVTVLSDVSAAQIDIFLRLWGKLGHNVVLCRASSDCLTISPVPCLTLSSRADFGGFVTDGVDKLTELIRQCRSALVASVGITQCLVCYATAQLMTTILLYENNNCLPNVQYFYIDFGLVLVPTILFGLTRATEDPLCPQIPVRKCLDTKYITSVIIQLMMIVISQWFALLMAQHQPWFESSRQNPSVELTSSDENYAIFSLSLFQYLSLFYIFSVGPPHRRRLWTNWFLTTCLVSMAVVSSVLVLDPPLQIQIWMQLKVAPEFDFRLAIFSLALVYFLLSVAVHLLIDYIFQRCRRTLPEAATVEDFAAPSLSSSGSRSVVLNVLYKPDTLSPPPPDILLNTHPSSAPSVLHWPTLGR